MARDFPCLVHSKSTHIECNILSTTHDVHSLHQYVLCNENNRYSYLKNQVWNEHHQNPTDSVPKKIISFRINVIARSNKTTSQLISHHFFLNLSRKFNIYIWKKTRSKQVVSSRYIENSYVTLPRFAQLKPEPSYWESNSLFFLFFP